jgi:uncharacterized protein (TIGR03435 family)
MPLQRGVAAIVLAVAVTAGPRAQEPPLTFEAVSIKPNTSGDQRASVGIRGRSYVGSNVPLRLVIMTAYELGLERARLVGGPDWLASERYDVVAALPEGRDTRGLPTMLRAMLADRFKLVTHIETRQTPVFALVLARSDGRLGPQLRRASVDCQAEPAAALPPAADRGDAPLCRAEVTDSITGRGQRMSVLARVLAQFVQRTVLDRTGLTGGFDFDIGAPEPGKDPGSDAAGGMFTALQEQLGLKLESTQAPVDFVVIDSIDRPTPD